MEYYCNICSKTIKCKSKKKHINSKKHIFLSPHVTNRYQLNNPKHYEIEDILEKYIPVHEYENSTEKDEYKYLYKKEEELKGDNITDENEGIVEYGNDFINYKIIHDRD